MKFKLFALLFITFGCITPLSFTTVQAAPTESVVVSDQKSNDEFKKALENFKPLVGIPGVGTPNANGVVNIGGLTFGDYINALYRLSISLAALLAVIKIIAAGVKYMFSDIVTHKEEAKKDIQGALIGLLIIIGAVIILNTVNTDITQNQILMDPANVDGSDNTILEDLAASQIGKLNTAGKACNEKFKTECTLERGLTKEECDERKGFFAEGNLIKYTTGYGDANLRDFCYYDPRTVQDTAPVPTDSLGVDPNTPEGLAQLNASCGQIGTGWTYNKNLKSCQQPPNIAKDLPPIMLNGSLDPNNPDDYLFISIECQNFYGSATDASSVGKNFEFNPTLKKCVEKR